MSDFAFATASASDWMVPGLAARVLAIGDRIDQRLLADAACHVQAPQAAETALKALRRIAPDVLVMQSDQADIDLVEALTTDTAMAPPILLLVDDGAVDMASWALALPDLEFVAPATPANELRRIIFGFARGQLADLSRPPVPAPFALRPAKTFTDERDVPPINAAAIRSLIRARRAREKFFPADLFSDPAWDMLLDLAAARLEGKQVSVSSLCIAAAVPTTTALRWIKRMCDEGILVRLEDPADRRRAFIALTDLTADAMAACLKHLMVLG